MESSWSLSESESLFECDCPNELSLIIKTAIIREINLDIRFTAFGLYNIKIAKIPKLMCYN